MGFQALGAFLSFPLTHTQGSWPARSQDAGGGTFRHPAACWAWARGTAPAPVDVACRGAAGRAVAAAGGVAPSSVPPGRVEWAPPASGGGLGPCAGGPHRGAAAESACPWPRAGRPVPSAACAASAPRARCSVPAPLWLQAAPVVPSLGSSSVAPRSTSGCPERWKRRSCFVFRAWGFCSLACQPACPPAAGRWGWPGVQTPPPAQVASRGRGVCVGGEGAGSPSAEDRVPRPGWPLRGVPVPQTPLVLARLERWAEQVRRDAHRELTGSSVPPASGAARTVPPPPSVGTGSRPRGRCGGARFSARRVRPPVDAGAGDQEGGGRAGPDACSSRASPVEPGGAEAPAAAPGCSALLSVASEGRCRRPGQGPCRLVAWWPPGVAASGRLWSRVTLNRTLWSEGHGAW